MRETAAPTFECGTGVRGNDMLREKVAATTRPWIAPPSARLTVLACALFAASIDAREPLDRITLIAPAAPGGGWDQTARAMQRALEADRLVRLVQVENVPGAAGVVGLAQFVNDPRHAPALLVTGLVMVGAGAFNDSPVSLAQ
ncbi:MAG TPA: hypothetical protein VFM39_03840, partial [bacterium]|nr:hypothetical protein [bacterium]